MPGVIHRGVVAGAIAVAVAIAIATPAAAEPLRRVALIDASPELVHAAETALAPWRIEIVEATSATGQVGTDAVTATAIAHDRGADRIAWIDRGELVVLDPSTGISERRPAPDGAGDPAAAAAVALSLKTVLRLPPAPAPGGDPVDPVPVPVPEQPAIVAPAEPAARVAVVPEVGGSFRIPFNGTLAAHPRINVAIGIVHPRWPRWRPSLVAGFGPRVTDVGRAGFQGSWSDVELGLQLAVALALSRNWAIVPRARLLTHRTRVQGRLPPQDTIDDVAYGGEAGLDLGIWWRPGRVSVGAGVGGSAWFGLPDYIRGNVMAFDSASVMGQVFATVLVDL